jgi:phospholipase/carboxylesterase
MAAPRSAGSGRLETRPTDAVPGRPLGAGVHALAPGNGVEALLAVPAGPPRPRPLLVFFHGAGGTAAQSLAAMAGPAADDGVLLLAPTSVAATWDLIAGGLGRDVAVLDAALAEVAASCAVTRTGFAGFSDGASYALSLGLANGDLVDAVLAFSPGFAAPPARVGRPAVWLCHGRADRVLPVEACGRRVANRLRDRGHPVVYEEFDGGHVLVPDLLRESLAWWRGLPRPGRPVTPSGGW